MIEEAVNSKFEFVRFKAALDILRTLQKFYSIELPNQIFLLKVSEGKLKIDVEEKIELKIEGEKAA